MSIAEKMQVNEVQDALARLFAGREPREGWLARCATLDRWNMSAHHVGRVGREIVIDGTLTSARFQIKDQPPMPVPVLWMDRKRRFVLTMRGMWKLGEEERPVGMDWRETDD